MVVSVNALRIVVVLLLRVIDVAIETIVVEIVEVSESISIVVVDSRLPPSSSVVSSGFFCVLMVVVSSTWVVSSTVDHCELANDDSRESVDVVTNNSVDAKLVQLEESVPKLCENSGKVDELSVVSRVSRDEIDKVWPDVSAVVSIEDKSEVNEFVVAV